MFRVSCSDPLQAAGLALAGIVKTNAPATLLHLTVKISHRFAFFAYRAYIPPANAARRSYRYYDHVRKSGLILFGLIFHKQILTIIIIINILKPLITITHQ